MQRIMKNVRSKHLFATGIVLQFPYLGKYYLGRKGESSCQKPSKVYQLPSIFRIQF